MSPWVIVWRGSGFRAAGWPLWFGSTSLLTGISAVLQLLFALWWEVTQMVTELASQVWLSPSLSRTKCVIILSVLLWLILCTRAMVEGKDGRSMWRVEHIAVSIGNSSFFFISALLSSSYSHRGFKLKNCLYPSIVCLRAVGPFPQLSHQGDSTHP